MGLGSNTIGHQAVSELREQVELISNACLVLSANICYLVIEEFSSNLINIRLELQKAQELFQTIECKLPTEEEARQIQNEFMRSTMDSDKQRKLRAAQEEDAERKQLAFLKGKYPEDSSK